MKSNNSGLVGDMKYNNSLVLHNYAALKKKAFTGVYGHGHSGVSYSLSANFTPRSNYESLQLRRVAKEKELKRSRLCRPQLGSYILKFTTVQFKKD